VPLRIDLLDRSPPHTPRLIEDLAATVPLFRDRRKRGKPIHPSFATLRRLGTAYLNDEPRLVYAGVPQLPGFQEVVDAWEFPILFDSVHLSYFLMAVVLARPDLETLFTREGEWDWNAVLRWLLLHGIRELRLWPYLTEHFIEELRARSIPMQGHTVTPLEYCIISERPDLLAAFHTSPAAFPDFFRNWLISTGVVDYQLYWLFSDVELRRSAERLPIGFSGIAGERIAPPGDVGFSKPASTGGGGAKWPVPKYASLNDQHPYLYLDLSQPTSSTGVIVAGVARPGLKQGLELASPCISLALPATKHAALVAMLDLSVPAVWRNSLWIKLEISDQYLNVFPASACTGDLLTLPIKARKAGLKIDVSFALQGVANEDLDNFTIPYALLLSLGIWQIHA
jgi:hypothetical protein